MPCALPNATRRAAALEITLFLVGCTEELDDYDVDQPVPEACRETQEGQAGDWRWSTAGQGSSNYTTEHPNDYASVYVSSGEPAFGDYELTPVTVSGLKIYAVVGEREFPWSFVLDAGPLNAGGRPVFNTVTIHAVSGDRTILPFNVEAEHIGPAQGGGSWIYGFKMKLADMPITRLTVTSDKETVEDISLPLDGLADAVSQALDAYRQITGHKVELNCPSY